MPSYFYGDITFGFDQFNSKQFQTRSPFYLKVRSKPGDFNLTHKTRVNKAKGDYVWVIPTTLKYAKDANSSKLKITQDKFAFEHGFKPKAYNNSDMTLQTKTATTTTPATNAWDLTTAVKFAPKKFGDAVRVWVTLDGVVNQKKEFTLKKSWNAQVKDKFFLGSKLSTDLKKLKSAEGILAFKDNETLAFFKTDCLKHVFTLGVQRKVNSKLEVAADVSYTKPAAPKEDSKEEGKEAPKGTVTANATALYKVNDSNTMKSRFEWAKDELVWKNSLVNNYKDWVKLVIADEVNVTRALKDPKNLNYSYGAKIELNL